MASRRLTIIMPGLASYLLQGIQQAAHLKFLNKFLQKGNFSTNPQSLDAFLINSFSKTPVSGTDLPIATLRQPDVSVICADPCYLHPDRDRLLLFSEDIKLTEQEAEELIAEIQPLLDRIGGELKLYRNKQWLLELKQSPEVTFHALASVEGKSVTPALPAGPDRDNWLRLGNEIQMLLSMLSLNEQRQARGELPVNSLWFWGQGELKLDKKSWQQCAGSSYLLRDLAERIQCDYQQSVEDMASWICNTDGNSLYITEMFNLLDTELVVEITQTILQPAWQMLHSGQIKQLNLVVPDYGTYSLSRWDSWKPW